MPNIRTVTAIYNTC